LNYAELPYVAGEKALYYKHPTLAKTVTPNIVINPLLQKK
jgi:CRISPR/Cas system-associated protein Csm6